jgi:hypothetical protein
LKSQLKNNMEKIKERFLDIEGKNIFTRINPSHFIDLFVGHDEQGRYAIKYRGNFKPESSIKSVAGIEVNQYLNEDFNTLQFSLIINDNKELFFTFCEDIVETTRSITDNRNAYKTILDRYYSWKKMFSTPKKLLSESEIMGLIGELLFLRVYLFEKYGKGEALSSWCGQELTHKDFSYNEIWYEVKVIHSGKDSVKISSLEQLQSNNEGELVVFTLEKMSASYNGIKINTLALEILNSLELVVWKDLFLSAIMSQSFTFDESYNDFVYEFVSMSRYLVNSDFPRLTKNDVNEAIIKAQYDLSLAILNNHLI